MKRSAMWKDFGAAYSLASLLFIISWKSLLYPVRHHYFDAQANSVYAYLAVLLNVLIFTAILFVVIQLSNLEKNVLIRRVFQCVFIALGLAAFSPLSYELTNWLSPETVRFVKFPIPVSVLLVCILFALREKLSLTAVTENLKLLSLFLLPFGVLIVMLTIREQLFADPRVYQPQSIQETVPTGPQPVLKKKIVWILFDELDFAALKVAKQNNIALPDLDRLTDQSLVAQNAFSPNNRTIDSIPALLTGKHIREATTISSNDLLLYPSDGSEALTLRESDDIFQQVKNRGGKSAIAGWIHPYCRIFQGKVSECFWSAAEMPTCSGFSGFTDCNLLIFQRALVTIPYTRKLIPSLPGANDEIWGENRTTQFERHRFLSMKADELVSKQSLNLLFFHFSVPHYPFIARTDLQGAETYFSALEIVNDTLGQLRQTLEKSGEWDSTTFIISSDHGWRWKPSEFLEHLPEEQRQEAADLRIPFIVKFAGQKSRIDYRPTLNTVITKQLILDILDEKVTNAEQLVPWLDDLQRTQPDLINRQGAGPKE